jgi:hypothetical protein
MELREQVVRDDVLAESELAKHVSTEVEAVKTRETRTKPGAKRFWKIFARSAGIAGRTTQVLVV